MTGDVNWIGGDVADNIPPWVTFQANGADFNGIDADRATTAAVDPLYIGAPDIGPYEAR